MNAGKFFNLCALFSKKIRLKIPAIKRQYYYQRAIGGEGEVADPTK
jgi:hypothetical protein